MENVAIKGKGGNDVQHKNWKGKILRILITIIRHGGLGHEGLVLIHMKYGVLMCRTIKILISN